MTKISVIMPVYNTKPIYLKQAIESILNQTFEDFKFLILNDSPENKIITNIINNYQDKRIFYYENSTNKGIARSYNHLLSLVDTKYVALMNHDDISLPKRLETQYDYLENNPEIGLIGTAYKKFGEINRFKNIYPVKTDAEIRTLLFFKSPIHHPTIMLRNQIVTQHKILYNENYVSLNDRYFYYDFCKYSKLGNLDKVLYKYRFHKDMTSKKQKDRILEEQRNFHKFWLQDNGINLHQYEMDVLDNYALHGRCRIKNKENLCYIRNILEKLVLENQKKHFLPENEFKNICAEYLIKRSLNAAWYGHIQTKYILEQTTLPIKSMPLLQVLDLVNNWRDRN